MKDLMSVNVYLPQGKVLICGSCLESTYPEGYAKLAADADDVYSLCLEQTHINMAVTKIAAMLATGRVKSLTFASVDRSPHCTQLHYIKHEIERTMVLEIPVCSYVVPDKEPVFVSDEAIDLSKSLSKLADLSFQSTQRSY